MSCDGIILIYGGLFDIFVGMICSVDPYQGMCMLKIEVVFTPILDQFALPHEWSPQDQIISYFPPKIYHSKCVSEFDSTCCDCDPF